MKIGTPQPLMNLAKKSNRWSEVLEALKTLPDGQALPVEMDEKKDVVSLQYFIFQRLNKNGQKYGASRRGMTLFIYKAKVNVP